MDPLYGYNYNVTLSLCLLILYSLTVLNNAKFTLALQMLEAKPELIRAITVQNPAPRRHKLVEDPKICISVIWLFALNLHTRAQTRKVCMECVGQSQL